MFLVVDCNSIIYRHACSPGMPLTSPDGEPTKAVFGFVNALDELGRVFRGQLTHTALCFDGCKPKLVKKLIDPEYKENRNRGSHDPSIGIQLERSYRLAKLMGYRCVKVDGYEADDGIATIVKRFSGRAGGFVIVTCDKDLMPLVSKSRNVQIYHPFKRKMLTYDDIKAVWGVPPNKVFEVMKLCGDKTDNVNGIPTVAAKTAAQWIKSFGTADNAIKEMSESPRYGPRIAATDLPKVKKLMALLEDCPCRSSLSKYADPGDIFSTDVLAELARLGFNLSNYKKT